METQKPANTNFEQVNGRRECEPITLDGERNRALRSAAIRQYESDALERPDPIDKVLGMGSASLQQLFEFVYESVKEETAGLPSIETVRDLRPEILLLIAIRRQVSLDCAIERIPHKR